MKKILIVLFVSFTLIGCKGGKLVDVASETYVTIEKSVAGYSDPSIVIACKDATFDGKTIIARGIVSIKGDYDWAVPMIEVHEDQVIIQIPSEERQYYTVTIEKK